MAKSQRKPSLTRARPQRADLHIHTTASDGRWTPEQVVAGCLAEGIELLAVADHDAVDNVLATEAPALEAGLAFLRAAEIGALSGGRLLHILGYGIDPTDPLLLGLLRENTALFEAADDATIRGLIALGYDLDYEAYLAYTYDRTRGGFKALNFCLDQGVAADAKDFMRNTRPQLNLGWPPLRPPRDVIDTIRRAGGYAILAHPGASLPIDIEQLDAAADALADLVDDGLAGVECYSQYHDVATAAFCVDWCLERDLIITGGSDYHGGFVGRRLGVPIVDTGQLHLGPLEPLIRR